MENKKRLIDANAVLEKLSRMIDYCKTDKKVNATIALFQVGDAIMDCKTVDAVEVVRCKDCKHYGYEPYDNGDKCCERWGEWIFPNEDDFCSCGERKDNG